MAFKPQKISVAKIKKKAREYYRNRKLTAQHRDQDKRECVYEKGSYRCAIGAGLNDAVLAEMRRRDIDGGYTMGCSVSVLEGYGIIEVKDGDLDTLASIQSAHDKWADDSRIFGASSEHAINRRNFFLAEIGLKKPEEL